MFEHWPPMFDPPCRVEVADTPVVVNVAIALPRAPAGFGAGLPLRVRAGGLAVDHSVPGTLHAWMRLNTGEWLCALTFRVHTGNGDGYIDIDRQWCPADAARPLR